MTIKSVTCVSPLEDDFVLLQVIDDEIEYAKTLFCAVWHKNETTVHLAASKIAKFLSQPTSHVDQERRLFLQQIYDELKPASPQPGSWFSFFSKSTKVSNDTCPLWDNIEAFFREYKTDDAFEGFRQVFLRLDATTSSICRAVTTFLVQPPHSFLQKHTGATYVSEFLHELFSKETDVPFLFSSICKNEAWPEGALLLLSVLSERESIESHTIFKSLLERVLDPIQQPKELLSIVEKLLQRTVHIDHYPIIAEMLSEKLSQFENKNALQVLRYVVQFLQLPKEHHGLACNTFVAQATFMTHCTEEYNKKSVAIPRSTISDSCCYVLSKRKVSVLSAAGSFKKVTSAICFDQSAYLVAQSVSSCRNGRTNALLAEEAILMNYRFSLREADFALELRGVPEIVQLRSKITYTKPLQNTKTVPVVSLIWDYYPHTLLQTMSRKNLSPTDKRELSVCLIKGIIAMHTRGLFHWDIKPQNVLCSDAMRAVWCDFGLMFRVGEAYDIMKKYHNGSAYGSFAYMAPELFVLSECAEKNFITVLVKAEIWALGKLLYELYRTDHGHIGETPWEAPMLKMFHSRPQLAFGDFSQFQDIIVQGFTSLQTGQDKLIDMSIAMLHPDLQKRPNLHECLSIVQN